jgi:hypothetical protein
MIILAALLAAQAITVLPAICPERLRTDQERQAHMESWLGEMFRQQPNLPVATIVKARAEALARAGCEIKVRD